MQVVLHSGDRKCFQNQLHIVLGLEIRNKPTWIWPRTTKLHTHFAQIVRATLDSLSTKCNLQCKLKPNVYNPIAKPNQKWRICYTPINHWLRLRWVWVFVANNVWCLNCLLSAHTLRPATGATCVICGHIIPALFPSWDDCADTNSMFCHIFTTCCGVSCTQWWHLLHALALVLTICASLGGHIKAKYMRSTLGLIHGCRTRNTRDARDSNPAWNPHSGGGGPQGYEPADNCIPHILQLPATACRFVWNTYSSSFPEILITWKSKAIPIHTNHLRAKVCFFSDCKKKRNTHTQKPLQNHQQ